MSIDNAAGLEVVTAPVDVIVSITDNDLLDWVLTWRRLGEDNELVLAQGNNELSGTSVASIDPSMMENGLYELRLVGSDLSGNTDKQFFPVIVDGNLKVGNFSITFEDLAIPMVGIPIEVNRTYDSRVRQSEFDFGFGWTIDYQNVDLQESRAPGLGWFMNTYPTGPLGVLTNFCVEPASPITVTVTLPDDQVEIFDVAAEPECNLTPILDVSLNFVARAGTTSKLEAIDKRIGRLDQTSGNIGVLAGDAYLNPTRYRLTTKAGYVYVLNQDVGIETINDPNGHVLAYSDSGISHSAGKGIDFLRDASGRITEITDPSGNIITYNYDAANDLVAVTDREFATTNFTYNDNHGLVDIVDPLGRRIVRNIYDDDGRLTAQEDNAGNRTEFNHNLAGNESIITDRLGRNTVLYYDDRGNVTSKVDALGHTYTYTYDQFDNQLSETNPLGHTTSATFDDRYNQLTQTDGLGNTVTYAYNALGQETLISDARGNAFTNAYDAVGNLLSVTDPLGHVAGQNIDANGLVVLRQDAEGNNTQFEHDGEGNITKETDAEGGVTTYTYDSNNNRLSESRIRTVNGVITTDTTTYEYDSRDQLIKTTDALGNVTRTEYDQLGREIAQIDAKGRRTEMAYDVYGRLISTTYPDGTSDTSTYDLEGNKLSDTDRLGRTTTYNYDALNRVISTVFADNASTSTVYDAAGRMISETDARGNTRTQVYDAANRRISSTDALGNTMSYGYDADGNMINQTDARGHTTTYSFNGLDQRVLTTFADNTTISSSFDKRGLEISKTDQNGRTTAFGYDGLGRLVSVTDALNQITQYDYDEVGNKLTQTDALGRVTTWGYDAINRPVSRNLPMGQQETYAYDAVGNRTSHTDFNGATHTYTYDADNNWLVSENYADGLTIGYGYNAIGLRTSATDANGSFTYTYDNRDRLINEVKHDGSELVYDYDADGNRTTLTTVVAGVSNTATYTFDALNRMSSVTDANGNTTSYSFDANSNQNRIDHANGTATIMDFDALNRVTAIAQRSSSDVLLSRLDYTLDNTGRRTAVTESTGRSSIYTYDGLYRLTGESIVDSQVGNLNRSFVYDAVSNRVEQTLNGNAVTYAYDDNDRLLSAGLDTYSYDDNGNTTSEIVDGVANSYTYDSRNRLVEASTGGVSQVMAYDPDGIRVRKSVAGVTTDYLIDSNRDYAQVLYEKSATSELNYTFGTDLVGLNTGSEHYTYHTDALGSTRALTDSTGNVADEIQYDAWGDVLSGGGVAENQYLYTGEQFDGQLGKTYLRARYYSSGVGRFDAFDTYQGNLTNPHSLHKYVYAANDPAIFTDPSGKSFTLSAQNIAAAILSSMILIKGYEVQFGNSKSKAYDPQKNNGGPSGAEVGFLVLATMAANENLLFKIFNLDKSNNKNKDCGFLFGPFYRYETSADYVEQARAGWMYGRTPRDGRGPTIQAYTKQRIGSNEVKFCTPVQPATNGRPSEVRWYFDTPGVVYHDDETVKIPIRLVIK